MSRIRTNLITNRMANGAPTVSNGLVISGVTTTSDIKVGTGVTLNVYGGATFSGIVTASSFSGIDTDKISEGNTEAEVVDTGSDGHFKVTTEGSERLRITSAGLVGIGTDTPYNPLAVVGSSADIMVYDTDDYSQNVSGGAVAFAGKDSAGNRKTLADVRGVANGANIGEFAIRTRRTGGTLTEALRIDSTGKIGVNTDFSGSQTWRNGQRLEIFGGSGNVTGELHLGANRGDGQQSVGSINFFDNTQDSTHRHIALIETDKSGTTSNKRGGAMVFYTKTDNVAGPTEKLRIHATGAVTQPNLPSFMAYGNASYTTINSGANLQPYVFPNTAHNTGSHYNTSNGKFTAPVTGVYQLNWNIFCKSDTNQTSAATLEFYVVKNGSTVSRLHNKKGYGNMGDDQQIVNLHVFEKLNANDEISINAYAYNVAWKIYGAHSTFSGALIG